MLLELSKMKDLPVGSFDEGGLIGKVLRVVINPDDGNTIGFLVKKEGFWGEAKVVSIQDVIDIDQAGLVIKSIDSLVPKNEVVRIAEILKSNFRLLGLKAISRDGKILGRVSEALIESSTGDLIRIYVKRFLSERVFSRSQIIEITSKFIKISSHKKQKVKEKVEALVQAKAA